MQQIDEKLLKEYNELFISKPEEIYNNPKKLHNFIENFSNHYEVRALSTYEKLPNEKILSNTYIESQRDFNILHGMSCMLGRHIINRLKIKPEFFPINDLNVCKFKLHEFKEFNYLKFHTNLTFFRISYDEMLILLSSVSQNNELQKIWENLKMQFFLQLLDKSNTYFIKFFYLWTKNF